MGDALAIDRYPDGRPHGVVAAGPTNPLMSGATAVQVGWARVYCCVTRRRREIAVRMAVGADAPDIVRLILRRMLSVLAVGSAVGVALSASASQAIASRLFGIDDRDYTAIAGAVVLFVFCGFAATLAPVRRATKTPPVAALRSE